jgi:hypothetical protein
MNLPTYEVLLRYQDSHARHSSSLTIFLFVGPSFLGWFAVGWLDDAVPNELAMMEGSITIIEQLLQVKEERNKEEFIFCSSS